MTHLDIPSVDNVDRHMITESIWADTISGFDELHFSHTPYRNCQPFKFDRDCKNGRCVVSAIADFTTTASDPSLSIERRTEAIKFLIHLMADIHNPLHVGFEKDAGGTHIGVRHRGQSTTLHEIWDNVLIDEKNKEFLVDGQTEVDPWLISDHLMSSVKDKASAAPYMLNLNIAEIDSYEKCVATGARMATEISTRYTCDSAYKNELNLYIENGTDISEAYIEDRMLIATELLTKAGIRLAELLNTIARLYRARMNAITKTSLSGKSSFSVLSSSENENIFMFLDMDFDEDLCLHSSAKPQAEAATLQSIEEIASTPPLSTERPPSDSTDNVEDEAAVGDKVTAQEDEKTKRARRNKKKSRAKNAAIIPIGGIENVVLIKRMGLLFVTSSHIVTEEYYPFQYTTLLVGFWSGSVLRTIAFSFDVEAFGFDTPSKELVVRCLVEIRNRATQSAGGVLIPVDAHSLELIQDDGSSLVFTNVGTQAIHPIRNTIQLDNGMSVSGSGADVAEVAHRLAMQMDDDEKVPGSEALSVDEKQRAKRRAQRQRAKENALLRKRFDGRLPTREEVWEADLREMLPNICVYFVGQVMAFIHRETMMDPSTPAIVATRFLVHLHPDGAVTHFLVDRKLYTGDSTPGIFAILDTAEGTNRELSQKMMKRRRSILNELSDLNVICFSSDPKRYRQIKKIDYFTNDVDPVLQNMVVAWSIHTRDRGLTWSQLETNPKPTTPFKDQTK